MKPSDERLIKVQEKCMKDLTLSCKDWNTCILPMLEEFRKLDRQSERQNVLKEKKAELLKEIDSFWEGYKMFGNRRYEYAYIYERDIFKLKKKVEEIMK
mgnify:CR=1 FL=1